MAIFAQLGNYKNIGLFIMRSGIGAMMIVHGFDKLKSGPAEWISLGNAMGNLHIHFFPVFWGFMCALTETVGGLFCILGLWFRLVCLLMIFNFVVASLSHFYAGNGIKETSHALELLFVFIGFLFLGPGLYSVDKK